MTIVHNPDIQEAVELYGIGRNDILNRWGNVISSFQAIPGLVGFWPMGSVQRSAGTVYDMSEQDRVLGYQGNPTFNIYNSFIPYIDLDGTGDYLDRADETDLDILGTESIFNAAVRGLTLGGWFWWDGLTTGTPDLQQQLIGKWSDAAGNASYAILNDPTGGNSRIIFYVTNDGSTAVGVATTATLTDAAWHFIIARFDPSTELAIFFDSTKDVNTTSIPASIFNGNSSFEIGRYQRVPNYLDGRASLCFLSANYLPDALIKGLYQQTKKLFGQ